MTFSRTASAPVGLTAYVAQTSPVAEPVLRVSLDGKIADLPREDAIALSDYIDSKFRGEKSKTSE